MPSMFMTDIQAAVGAGGNVDIQPAVGQAYCVTEVGSDAAQVGNVPDVQISVMDGVLAVCVVVVDPTTAVEKGLRSKEIYITNATYLRLTNTGAAGSNIGWTGYRVSPNKVITDIYTVPNAARVDIQPPAGEVWRITEIGAETPGVTNHPDMTFFLTDGVLIACQLLVETEDVKQTKLLNWYISNDIYLQILDTSGADNDVAIIGTREEVTFIGDVQDVVGSATLDIQPPAGSQYCITEITCQTWAVLGPAVPPASSPDILISLYDGAVLSDLIEGGSVSITLPSLLGDRPMNLFIDNATYLRITELSTANNEVGFCGYVAREYNP